MLLSLVAKSVSKLPLFAALTCQNTPLGQLAFKLFKALSLLPRRGDPSLKIFRPKICGGVPCVDPLRPVRDAVALPGALSDAKAVATVQLVFDPDFVF